VDPDFSVNSRENSSAIENDTIEVGALAPAFFFG
jgi:hypothetical protein